jgi:hypothetical protein
MNINVTLSLNFLPRLVPWSFGDVLIYVKIFANGSEL